MTIKDLSQKIQKDMVFEPLDDLEMKALGDDLPPGFIAGYASTADVDLVRDVILPGAFNKSIKGKGLKGPKGIKLLIGHDRNKPAGIIRELKNKAGKLFIAAQLALDIQYVEDFYKAAKMIGGLSFSVGYRLVAGGYEFKENDDGIEIMEIKEANLLEVSVVTIPANEEAVMETIKDDEGGVIDPLPEDIIAVSQFEKALVAQGYVGSRNRAHAITEFVKSHADLFVPSQALEADEKVSLSSDQLNLLQKQLSEMKSLLQG